MRGTRKPHNLHKTKWHELVAWLSAGGWVGWGGGGVGVGGSPQSESTDMTVDTAAAY